MRKRVGAPGQGSALKMAVAVTFCRLLGRSGPAALSLPRGVRCFGARTSPTGEKITHTGQVYDDEDYRKVRFLGRQKETPQTPDERKSHPQLLKISLSVSVLRVACRPSCRTEDTLTLRGRTLPS
ncbi:NADH dehydrogenase [ubiquinone] iron-sulfur protein 6, mitochondrial isoform X2 [Meles meles]|uniref:NADH dehydrogenase [ubiquinone] iron-sulfur protein 6, mitochondrial isoform X2 n=1 Tax=Meles meles TaxID=9662 RepID=UPI001E69F836|nr:NADH dehydrogenase [ubiquinone] iron-sulfur protein 6, mitochondrial isoform X2 [Meles meles]